MSVEVTSIKSYEFRTEDVKHSNMYCIVEEYPESIQIKYPYPHPDSPQFIYIYKKDLKEFAVALLKMV